MTFTYTALLDGDLTALLEHMNNSMEEIENTLREREIVLHRAAPLAPYDGMIVIADGTLWNPGSGRGYYGYRDAAWRFLE